MNIWLVSLCIGGLLTLVGTVISWAIGLAKCNKQNLGISVYEGFIWALPTTAVMAFSNYSPYFLSIFSEPMKFFDKTMEQSTADMLGRGFAMMLMVLPSTTLLIHNTDLGVCKPTKDELNTFKENLLKKLKAKQQDEEQEAAEAKKDNP